MNIKVFRIWGFLIKKLKIPKNIYKLIFRFMLRVVKLEFKIILYFYFFVTKRG